MNQVQTILAKAGIDYAVLEDGRALIPCGSHEIELTEKGLRRKVVGQETYLTGYIRSPKRGPLNPDLMADQLVSLLNKAEEPQTKKGSLTLLNKDGSKYTGLVEKYFEK